MAKLKATTTFRHGYDTYEEGTEHDVPDVLAGYFVANGWATSDDPALMSVIVGEPSEATLEVDSAAHDSASTTG